MGKVKSVLRVGELVEVKVCICYTAFFKSPIYLLCCGSWNRAAKPNTTRKIPSLIA